MFLSNRLLYLLIVWRVIVVVINVLRVVLSSVPGIGLLKKKTRKSHWHHPGPATSLCNCAWVCTSIRYVIHWLVVAFCLFSKSSIRSRKRNKELDSSEISETNEINEISRSPEDSVVSNEDAPASSSGYANCNCHSTTGIHQSSCVEYSDGKWNYASRNPVNGSRCRFSSVTLILTRRTNVQTLLLGL